MNITIKKEKIDARDDHIINFTGDKYKLKIEC